MALAPGRGKLNLRRLLVIGPNHDGTWVLTRWWALGSVPRRERHLRSKDLPAWPDLTLNPGSSVRVYPRGPDETLRLCPLRLKGLCSNRVLGGEGQGALRLELVDEQVAGTQPQCAFRCGLSAPAPLAHFGTAGARQPGIHARMDVVTCRARRQVQVCAGCRAPRSARPRRTPH